MNLKIAKHINGQVAKQHTGNNKMPNVRAVIIDERKAEETNYEVAEIKSVVNDVNDASVYVNADAISLSKVVGIVVNSYYEDGVGLIVECDIVDEDVVQLIEKDMVCIAPNIIVDKFTSNYVQDIDRLFTTSEPDYVVGETEVM